MSSPSEGFQISTCPCVLHLMPSVAVDGDQGWGSGMVEVMEADRCFCASCLACPLGTSSVDGGGGRRRVRSS